MSDPNFAIESDRLLLTYLLPENDAHCDFLVSLWTSPTFIAAVGPTKITTRDAARAILTNRFRAEHARNGYGTYLINLKNQPNSSDNDDSSSPTTTTPIGTVSLMRGEPPDCYTAPDLGFAVLPAYLRQGFAVEAARALLDYVAREQGVVEVFGFTDPKNEASRGVFRKLGFEDRGAKQLRVFGNEVGQVFVTPGMNEDLGVYGF